MVNKFPNFINRLKEFKRIAANMVQRVLNDGGKDGRHEDREDCSSLGGMRVDQNTKYNDDNGDDDDVDDDDDDNGDDDDKNRVTPTPIR